MKLTIESTKTLTAIDGVPVRVWHGLTPAGLGLVVYVHRLAVPREADAAEFERELREMGVPVFRPGGLDERALAAERARVVEWQSSALTLLAGLVGTPAEGYGAPGTGVGQFEADARRLRKRFRVMEQALQLIEQWKLPGPGRDGQSFSAAYGSNGEREYVRALAREALAKE